MNELNEEVFLRSDVTQTQNEEILFAQAYSEPSC